MVTPKLRKFQGCTAEGPVTHARDAHPGISSPHPAHKERCGVGAVIRFQWIGNGLRSPKSANNQDKGMTWGLLVKSPETGQGGGRG